MTFHRSLFLLAILLPIVFVSFTEGKESPSSGEVAPSFVRTVPADIPQKKLKTIIVDHYYPYSFVNRKGNPDGFSVDLIKAVTQVMGREIEIRAGHWEEAQRALAKGEIDLLPMMAYSRERDTVFDFSSPHTIAYDAFFIRKGAKPLSSLRELQGKSVIVMNGDAAHNYLRSSGMVKTGQFILADSLPDALRLLAAGRGDTAIMPKLVGLVDIKDMNLANLEASPGVIEAYNRPFSFAVKSGDQALLERLSQGLIIIKKTGDYRKIYEKWFGAPAPQELFPLITWKYIGEVTVIIVVFVFFLIFWSVSLKRKVALRTQHLEMEIAQRKKAEKYLQVSEERFRLAMDASNDVLWDWDIMPDICYFSPAYQRMLGYEFQEFPLTSQQWVDLIHPEDRELILSINQDCIKNRRQKFEAEFRLKARDGSWKWILGRGKVISRDASGRALRMIGTHVDISERKWAVDRLRESEVHFRTLADSGQALIWTAGIDKQCNYFNKPWLEFTGRTLTQELGDGWTQGVHPADLNRCLEIYTNAFDRREKFSMTYRLRRCDGEYRWIQDDGTPHFNGNGEFIGYIGYCLDITDLKQAENRQKLVNRILEIINSDIEAMDSIKRIILLIKEFTCFEAVGLRLKDGEDYPYFETRGFPDYFVLAENYLCSRNENDEIIRDTKGNPYLECMCGNILMRRTDAAKPFFTKGGSFWTNNTTELLASTTDEDRQARTRNRCNGEGYESVALIPLRYADEVIGLLQFNDKRTGCFTLEMIEYFEKIGAAVGIAINRRRTEMKLREEEERYRTVANFTYDWEYWIGADGNYRYVSPVFERISGHTVDELIQNPDLLETIVHPSDREMLLEHMADPRKHPCPFDFRIISRNDEEKWLGHRCQQVYDAQGNSLGWRGSNRNITKRKKIEEQLRQSQKMEAIGTLAGGIAHDFNNILGAIYGFVGMAQEELPVGSTTREWVDEIFKASERARNLVQQILSFSRHAEAERKPLLIVPVIKEVVKLLRHALPSTINLQQNITVKDGLILADATQIHQILMNLCTNAGHAMHERGGILTIGLKQIDIAGNDNPVTGSLPAGPYLELKVSDTGHGIDSAIIGKIFDPFFTTKKKDGGTGLGLSVVHGIVHSCGGAINVESSVNAGTTFTIYFPAISEQVMTLKDEIKKAPAHGREKIMIIDDQDYLLKMLQLMLSRLGYAVTTKQDPRDALDLFRRDPFAQDMIITDQTMPDMTGFDMAKKMLSIRPDIPIILCTGFSDLVSAEDARAIGIREYLMKPIAVQELAQAIRNVFDNNKEKQTGDQN